MSTHQYDGASRRVTKTSGSVTRHYYYSDQWQVLEERTGTSESAERWFVWGVRSIDDLVRRERDSEPLYVLGDALNVTAVINASGTVQERYGYSGFGTVRYRNASFGSIGSSGKNWDTLFGSYRYDTESGLYQVRYRFLHPPLGRWMNSDPIEEAGGINLYGFVNNNTVNSIDPFGLIISDPRTIWPFNQLCPKPPSKPPKRDYAYEEAACNSRGSTFCKGAGLIAGGLSSATGPWVFAIGFAAPEPCSIACATDRGTGEEENARNGY